MKNILSKILGWMFCVTFAIFVILLAIEKICGVSGSTFPIMFLLLSVSLGLLFLIFKRPGWRVIWILLFIPFCFLTVVLMRDVSKFPKYLVFLGESIQYTAKNKNISFEEAEVYGDPSWAEGLTVEKSVSIDSQHGWVTTMSFHKDGTDCKTRTLAAYNNFTWRSPNYYPEGTYVLEIDGCPLNSGEYVEWAYVYKFQGYQQVPYELEVELIHHAEDGTVAYDGNRYAIITYPSDSLSDFYIDIYTDDGLQYSVRYICSLPEMYGEESFQIENQHEYSYFLPVTATWEN